MWCHRHFLKLSITWTLGFVVSNLILDGHTRWHWYRNDYASLSMNGCAMPVRHSQAVCACQTAGMKMACYFLLVEFCLTDFIRTCKDYYQRWPGKQCVCLQIGANGWILYSDGVYNFVILFSCFIGSRPKESFATKEDKLLTAGHADFSKVWVVVNVDMGSYRDTEVFLFCFSCMNFQDLILLTHLLSPMFALFKAPYTQWCWMQDPEWLWGWAECCSDKFLRARFLNFWKIYAGTFFIFDWRTLCYYMEKKLLKFQHTTGAYWFH